MQTNDHVFGKSPLYPGVGIQGANEPREVYRDVPEREWHVPLSQIIYVGDGASDMPVFELLNGNGGMAIGVYDESATDWDALQAVSQSRRVQNLAAADYGEESELMRSLKLAVQSVCKLIALRRMGKGE